MSKDIVNAIFEMFEMTRTPRSGWQRAGLKNGIENVAEHACLAAQIAFVLAVMEGVKNPEKVACEALFHDNGESRLGDQNKLTLKYFDKTEGEKKAFGDFVDKLPSKAKELLLDYFNDFEKGKSERAIIARDADLLQLAFQARYYLSIGYKCAQSFIDCAGEGLRTKSAKDIFKYLPETEFFEWYFDNKN